MNDEVIHTDDVILQHREGIDLISANLDLSAISFTLITVMNRERILQDCLENIKNKYDYILLDCSPSLDMIILNALCQKKNKSTIRNRRNIVNTSR